MTTPCDQLICADWVLTVDPDRRVIDDGAVACTDGRIVGVGATGELEAQFSPAARVERPGHALVPGLVNAHTHLAMTMFRGLADDMDLSGFLGRLLPAEARVLDPGSVGSATAAAALESLRGGVTTALDMYFFPDAARAAGAEVGMRVITGPVMLDGEGPDGIHPEERIEWSGEWLAANPPAPGWRPAMAPHSTYLVGPDRLAQVHELAGRHEATVHIHAAETASEVADVRERHGARPVELLDRLGMLDERLVVAHGVHLDDAELVRLCRSGASVAHCPASNLKLAAGLARVVELLDGGANVAIGTDGPASSNDLDMFTAMRLTALLHKGLSDDATVLPAHQVLAMATIGGARALGLEHDLGSLEVGKRADLVAVDLRGVHTQPVYDPVSALVYAAGRGEVTDVWVDGEAVIADRRPTRIDSDQVTAGLSELRARVLAAIAH